MNFFRKKPPLNQRSQIAVIITFVIAVILLFIAVFINISKVSQVKTTTSTAADKAALSLASQLGSMSHYYKDKVVSGGTEKVINGEKVIESCSTDWVSLAIITGITVISPHTLYVGAAIGAVVSATMLSGISEKFKAMTGYNGLREAALFQALRDTQSDDVELKATGEGIFRDEATGENYNLSAIPEMLNQRVVSRFKAWYYTKRLLLVRDKDIKTALDTFISKLEDSVDTDNWSGTLWKRTEVSYIIKRLPSLGGLSSYDITCSSGVLGNCPDWVKDSAQNILRMVRIDASDHVSGGFLSEKLISSTANGGLLNRLQDQYNNKTFCGGVDCKINPGDANNLIEDLREFLLRSKEVLNMPVSDRLNNLTQWLPLFYDYTKHKPGSRESIDGNNDYDIYLRLTRDWIYINSWIKELERLNRYTDPATGIVTGISKDIESKHGECTWGRGVQVNSSCNTIYDDNCAYCPHHYCGESESDCACRSYCCHTPQKCAWEGIYYTCCDANMWVCTSGKGDLYGVVPGWCAGRGRRDHCSNSCRGCSPNTFDCGSGAINFMGQLAYNNTSGPTEVNQATTILRALKADLARLQIIIATLADAAPYANDPLRNKITYAWKDKPKPDGSQQFSHLVEVKIDGYPKNLPNITESRGWGWLAGFIPIPQKCRQLNDYQGNFTITTSRYDQDQPTDIGGWKLRRRRIGPGPTGQEFSPVVLEHIVKDVQDTGTISSIDEGYVRQLLYWYAINSWSQVAYGPEKSDIKIIKTDSD